jgi:hypothetical protein
VRAGNGRYGRYFHGLAQSGERLHEPVCAVTGPLPSRAMNDPIVFRS